MLNWLFKGKKSEAECGKDFLWQSNAARLRGFDREVGVLVEAERSVLVVALGVAALDELESALARHHPWRCADLFAKAGLRERLSKAGTVTLALGSVLGSEVEAPIGNGVDILVYCRNDTRAADDAILAFADSLGPNTYIAFHLSLDDPLLKAVGGSRIQTLLKLGMNEDEPMESALVTRTIRSAQEKRRG